MIFQLEIENFYSFRERQTIDLTVGTKVPEEPGRLVEIHDDAVQRAPSVVAVYGPNASGKSNLLRAISFLSWFIQHSFTYRARNDLPYLKFGSKVMIGAPTYLSVRFTGPEDLLQPELSRTCPYTYTLKFAAREEGVAGDRVLSEIVQYKPKRAARYKRVIERNEAGEVKGAPELGLGREKEVLQKILRPDASVIATLAQLNNSIAQRFVESASTVFSNIFVTRLENETKSLLQMYASDESLLMALNRDIRRIDLGVQEVQIVARDGAPIALFSHAGLEQPIEFPLESHGTQQFVQLFPKLYDTLMTGGVAVLDELDSAIHPVILPEILRWFSDQTRNPHGAQLWLSCHSVSLLDTLLKEEVLLCEKSDVGATQVYGLRDIQGIRRSENFGQKYLGGVYGAIPRVG